MGIPVDSIEQRVCYPLSKEPVDPGQFVFQVWVNAPDEWVDSKPVSGPVQRTAGTYGFRMVVAFFTRQPIAKDGQSPTSKFDVLLVRLGPLVP
jgi:hypothetical protein